MLVFRLFIMAMFLSVSFAPAGALQIPRVAIGLNDVIDAVEKPFRFDNNGNPELENVRADFFQRSTFVAKQRELRADGQMYLKPASSSQPVKFRFDYYRPARQEIICDGRTLWVYLPENRQVIMSDVAEFLDPFRYNPARDRAINFLQGLGRISKDFTITFAERPEDMAGNYILELRPNRASVMIEKLFITVSRDAVITRAGGRPTTSAPPAIAPEQHLFAILSTTMVDHDGNSTTMEFSNIRSNEMITETIFSFDVPPNVQLVRPPSGR